MAVKVLVTGAGGFIGSHLVERLLVEGYAVRAFVRYSSAADKRGNMRYLPVEANQAVELYTGDLRDAEAVRKAMQGVEAVYHLGALIAIPYSYQHPEETFAVNVQGTLNVLQAMRQQDIPCGVIVSTSEVYGSAQYIPIDEKHPLQPQSPYSASKISAEAAALSFHRSFGTPVVVVRPFNTFGPRQSARAVIPTIISQALMGDAVRLGAVDTYRDYTLAADTASGLLAAARSKDALGQVVNLGTGHMVQIGALAEQVIRLVGRQISLVAAETDRMRPAKSEVSRLQSDNRLAKQLLGWEPRYTLDEGLQQTIAWIDAHRDQFDPQRYMV
jgi:NAD dependent epimerase/dehydratase